jgi:ABC-2 type transport system permease protein
MSPWRLEALRLWRTRRVIALGATFGILGLGVPVLTYYLPDIVGNSANGVQVILPPPTAAQALRDFGSNVSQLGTLVVVVVAAATLAIDAHPALAAFYRSRTRRAAILILPRCVAVTLAGVLALGLGILGAWYETAVLLGPLSPGALAAGFGLEALWVCFCVTAVALWASVARGVPAVTGASLASLLTVSLLAGIPALRSWSPTALAGSAADLIGAHHPGVPWHALAVTAPATAALVAGASYRLARRAA